MEKATPKLRAGFVRVLVPERNKTIQIRKHHANNPNYMAKHGLVAIPEPKQPPAAAPEPQVSAPKVTKAAPVKQSTNG